MVKVSVIVPVYNVENYLGECLDSILNQTLKDIEIICVDDGSTDSSLSILEEYAEMDSRIKVLQQKNQYAGVARNNGMKIASGEYLTFLDSDDVFDSHMLEKMYSVAVDESLDIVVCRADRFDTETMETTTINWTIREALLPSRGPFSADDIAKDFFKVFVWWPWDKLYRREFIEELGLNFQGLRSSNDLFFVASSVLSAKRIDYINDVLVHQRKGTNTSISVTREKSWDNFYLALSAVKEFLLKNNLMARFEQDFVNYCLHFSLWHLNSMHGKSYALLLDKLRKEWFEEFGIADKSSYYFYNKTEYKQYKAIMDKQEFEILYKDSGVIAQTEEVLSQCEPQYLHFEESSVKPKVSIVVPVCNVENYLHECMDSIINQTLEDIEIICVNDGSSDHSLDILEEYAQIDKRIKIITKKNTGYGHAMNLGIDVACGEYLGIVEPDDYIALNMYEDLYNKAVETDADIVKADFYRFIHDENGNLVREYNQLTKSAGLYNKLINPAAEQEVFRAIMNTWSGIYKLDFINKFGIRHSTTPGASFQDNGFWFKGFCLTQKLYFVDKPYYMNRRDNPNSSVKNQNKVYCANIEYQYIKKFLLENNLFEVFKDIYIRALWSNCTFTLSRIDAQFKEEYIKNISKEFKDYKNDIDKNEFFTESDRSNIHLLIERPEEYYSYRMFMNSKGDKALEKELYNIKNGLSFRIGRIITYIPRKLLGKK